MAREFAISPSIFISYRRGDSAGSAGRLYDHLARAFPGARIFMDVDVIEPGADFISILDQHVSTCNVLLAVIGAGWLEASDEKNRPRLEDPIDFVRLDLLMALKREVPIIPVLVDGATMPGLVDLPDALQPLAHRHALEVRHDRFGSDVQQLIDAISRVINAALMARRDRWESAPPPLQKEGTIQTSARSTSIGLPIETRESEELTPRRLFILTLATAYVVFALFISIERFDIIGSTRGPGILLLISFESILLFWQLMNIFLLVRMSFVAFVADGKNRFVISVTLILALGVLFGSKMLMLPLSLNFAVAIACSMTIYVWRDKY